MDYKTKLMGQIMLPYDVIQVSGPPDRYVGRYLNLGNLTSADVKPLHSVAQRKLVYQGQLCSVPAPRAGAASRDQVLIRSIRLRRQDPQRTPTLEFYRHMWTIRRPGCRSERNLKGWPWQSVELVSGQTSYPKGSSDNNLCGSKTRHA